MALDAGEHRSADRYSEVERAAEQLALAVGILSRTILQGIVRYLLNGGSAPTRRGTIVTEQVVRTHETKIIADEAEVHLVRQLRSSKLDSSFAAWVEQNWKDLLTNPLLRLRPRPRTGGGSASADHVSSERMPRASIPEEAKVGAPPSKGTKTTANRIDVLFNPDKSKKVKKCDRIVHVQFIRAYVDGRVIKHSDYSSAYKHKKNITTDKGWAVDCLAPEKTPDYQQGTGDGHKNGGSTNATMSDAPQTAGGDKGFYDPITNPSGWKSFAFEFAVYAWCMHGPDCGKWYEGLTWVYKKTWENHRDGKPGASTVIDDNVVSGPSKGQLEAFDKFNSAPPGNRGGDPPFVPCS